MWLWVPDPAASPEEVTVTWQAYLRRFDLEHAFRFIKSRLGWNKPLLRDPAAGNVCGSPPAHRQTQPQTSHCAAKRQQEGKTDRLNDKL
jgi:hypothetical protein